MDKKGNKGIIIALCTVIVVLIGAITYAFVSGTISFNVKKENKNKNEEKNDVDKITKFNYYSGSSGYAIELSGTRNDELINVDFKEYDGANQSVYSYTITFEKFKNLLNSTSVEDCEKHTYDYQCGDRVGCSYAYFYVYYEDSSKDKVCYQINDNVSSFFENMEEKEEDNNLVNNEEVENIKELDLTKSLNTNNYEYSNVHDVDANLMFYTKINEDQRSVTLSIDWEKFGPHSGGSLWLNQIQDYQITGFSKHIETAFIGGVGQSVQGTNLFFLMEDGTVEYTPIFVLKTDSQNNNYYAINYKYDISSDGKEENQHFESEGIIDGVKNVIKLYSADVSYGISGWVTVIGALQDGSFYDLGEIINNN